MNGSIEIRYQKFLVLLYMLCLQIGENLSISFCYIESGCVISNGNRDNQNTYIKSEIKIHILFNPA